MKKLNLKQFKNISLNDVIGFFTVTCILLTSIFFYCENFLEPKAYDFLICLSAKKEASKDIILVSIDDESIQKIGRWPWNRSRYADIFDYLENYGKARIIAFDSTITSHDPNNDEIDYAKRISKFKTLITGIFFNKQKNFFNIPNDTEMEKILKKNSSLNVIDKRNPKLIKKSEYKSSSYTLKAILSSVSGTGSVLLPNFDDGIIRTIEPIFLYKNAYYPSLSLAVFEHLHKNSKYILTENYLKTDYSGINMPLNTINDGSVAYIKWYKSLKNKENYPYQIFSAWQILKSYKQINNNEKPIINPEIFKNKIILVGVTAIALNDLKSTPLAKDYPGIDIQATCINNILDNDYMVKPSLNIRLTILISLLFVTFLAVLLLHPLYSAIILTLMMLGYFEICMGLAYPSNYALDIITPQAFILCSLTIGYGYKYFLEGRNKKQIQKVMAKYVSNEVMTDILRDIEGAKLGGKRSEITIVFADIRGFTTMTEMLDPKTVSDILNLYFSEMVPIILKNKGMINKFMGDAILAVFGAPVENPDHAMLGIKSAVEMLEKLDELQKLWADKGMPRIEIGIGVSTGIAFVGNIGSEDRLEYSVIGDTVNIASRLDEINKLFNTKLLISPTTYEKVKDTIEVREIKSVLIKGRSEPMNIYEVKGFKNS